MTKLAKYLQPFLFSIVLAIALLFAQSIAELMLPNRMSDIVNVGLQQSGIEHAAPDAISPEGLALMLDCMPPEARALTEKHYQPFSKGASSPKGPDYDILYPNMGETVYALYYPDNATREALDEAFGNAAYAFVRFLQSMAANNPAAEAPDASAENGMSFDFDIAMAYQLHSQLAAMGGGKAAIPTETGENAMSDMYTQQVGVLFAKAFYTELGVDTAAMQTRYIWRAGLYMLLISLAAGLASVAVGFLAPRVSSGAARNLRKDLFTKVEGFSHREFDRFSSASLITRCTNDVQQVQMMTGMGLRMLCSAPIMGVGGIIMALNKAPSMSWIIALAVIVLLGVVIAVVLVALPRFKVIQEMIDKLNKVSREILNGLMVIRAFGTQKHEIHRFDKANKDLTRTNLFVGRVMAVVMPVITFIMSGSSLLIIWVGARQISDSAMQIGDMMAFVQYAMQVIMSFMMLSMMLIMVPRAAVSGDRIAEVLGTALSIADPPQPKTFPAKVKGQVTFTHVSFRYDNAAEDALSDITFTARPGQTTAIIGATGAGKTTIANLLLRFYDVTQGGITVDGIDIREVKQSDLRAHIGYVPQKGLLLTGSIASNIRYGRPDAADSEVAEAAAVAQALDFISEKEEKFESEIAQAGANVSGGQKQRLSIARALAKKPEILVFDDSFSALDFQTDAKLRKALRGHTADATVIVIAQRVGTIMNAEQILVVDEGKIVGRGTHDELLKTCPAYYEIASSQIRLDGKEVPVHA